MRHRTTDAAFLRAPEAMNSYGAIPMFAAPGPANLATAPRAATVNQRGPSDAAGLAPDEILADTNRLPWWNYKLPRPFESRFAIETDADRNHQIRFWIAVSLAFSWVTFAVDVKAIPDVWQLAFLLRLCVVTPVSVAAMRLLGAPSPGWWRTMLASTVPPIVAHLSVLIGFAASAEVDTFRAAVVLCIGILSMNALFPLRLRDAAVFTVTALTIGDAINVIGAAAHHATIGHPEMILVTHVLAVLSLLVRLLAERESRHSFVLGLRLRIRAEDLARSNARLQEMSNTDPLTGLANRRSFDLALAQAWQSAAGSGTSVALMMIDVDHFKLFNDIAGHLEGDRCLTTVARTIAGQVRRGQDLAARFGGEEFVILMPGAGCAEAHVAAERVRTAIATLRVFHPGRTGGGFVSVSIGVAMMYPCGPDTSPAGLLKAADAAMYEAKAGGRDRVMGGGRPAVDAETASRRQLTPDSPNRPAGLGSATQVPCPGRDPATYRTTTESSSP